MADLELAAIEEIKLLANALDRASTACFTVGLATPVAATIYGFGNIAVRSNAFMVICVLGWLSATVSLHYMARRILRKLR